MNNTADTEWERHEKLVAKARKMLAKPIAEAIVSKDGTVTIKPTGWRFVDIARMAEIAIELGMLAVGSTTKKGLLNNALSAPTAPIINVSIRRDERTRLESSSATPAHPSKLNRKTTTLSPTLDARLCQS